MENAQVNIVYATSHRVRHHLCGPDGNIKLPALLDLFQDAAAEHAGSLGCGMDELNDLRYLWVLYRLEMQVLRPPRLGEEITVRTYPTGVHKLFAVRQYAVRDAEERLVVRGTSFWLVLNAANLRPVPPARVLDPEKLDDPGLERYFDFDAAKHDASALPALGETFTVRHSDIDLNKHLNNAVYSRVAVDWLGKLTGRFVLPENFRIDFTHAGKLGDVIHGFGAVSPEGSFRLEGRSASGETVFFSASGRL